MVAPGDNAVVEGWALYSEQLAEEMGRCDDHPLGDVGRLKDEAWIEAGGA